MRPIQLLAPLLLSLASALAQANTAIDKPAQALHQAQAQQLWLNKTWLNLLHVRDRPSWFGSSKQSYVRDQEFFLAANGKTDARAELEATIHALFEEASTNDQADQHAQCRFVARFGWLASQLDLSAAPNISCPAYQEFRKLAQADRATLIFPSYYLNSPSSMFGHSLLRLDTQESQDGGEYVALAVNFGAEVDASDNSIFYAFKGLTGGYPGQFKIDRYFKKIQEYNRDENRDIWEYALNLRAHEVERLIQHIWELQGVNFDYYFFDQNCSFRILELLEIARPEVELTQHFHISAIPVDTVRAVEAMNLTSDIQFRPARGTVLRAKLEHIPSALHPWVESLAQNPQISRDPQFQALPIAQQAQLTEAAYKYLRLKANGQQGRESAKASYQLLKTLRQLSSALPAASKDLTYDLAPPTTSHLSRRLLTGILRSDSQTKAHFGVRLSLHSLEERKQGFLPGGQINLGNLELSSSRDKILRLERLDIIDIFSLSPRDRFFQPLSWSALVGAEQQWTRQAETLTYHATAGAGHAKRSLLNGQLYAMATARLEHSDAHSGLLQGALGMRLGYLKNWSQSAAHVKFEAGKFADGEQRISAHLIGNWSFSEHLAMQLDWQWRRAEQISDVRLGLRLQHYY